MRALRLWCERLWRTLRPGKAARVMEGNGWAVAVEEGPAADIPAWKNAVADWDTRSELGSASLTAAAGAGKRLFENLPKGVCGEGVAISGNGGVTVVCARR